MAEASATMPATATSQGRWFQGSEALDEEGETEELTEGGMVRTCRLCIFFRDAMLN